MMRRLTIVLVALTPFLMMCGTAAPGTTDALAVNDHLRGACAGFATTDDQIKMLITDVEADRLGGADYQGMISAANAACSNPSVSAPVRLDCQVCMTAIVNQVYGQ